MKIKDQKNNVLRFTCISPASNVVFNLLLIMLAAFCLIPLFLVVSISLSSEESIRNFGYRLIPQEFSLKGYSYLLQQRSVIFRSLVMSVQVTCLGTALGVLLTSSMGYVLSRAEYKLHKFFTWFIFIPMIFNGGLVSTYFVVSQFLGFRNTIWALIMPLCVTSFNVIVCRTFFRTTIPDSVVESATIDGAGQLTIYFRIVLPLSLPVLATIGLFLSFAYWNDWFQSMLYIDNTRFLTLQAYLNRLLQDINFLASDAAVMLGGSRAELIASMPKEAARMAIVVIAVAPIACVYPFFQRYFISGLTIGAVKG
jgi:putative aldouronate transport system permease protein